MHISCSYDMSYVITYDVYGSLNCELMSKMLGCNELFQTEIDFWRIIVKLSLKLSFFSLKKKQLLLTYFPKISCTDWLCSVLYHHVLYFIKVCGRKLPTAVFDPRGRPTFTAIRDHCFCTCGPFVRPHYSKENKFQAKHMFATGETVGLAEWIIDDTCLVSGIFVCSWWKMGDV